MSKYSNQSSNNSSTEFDVCTVISGSFRKHLKEIAILKEILEDYNIKVLSPGGARAINPEEEFIILDSDLVTHPKILQDSVFAKIRRSAFLVVANFDGYLGKATILEIGYALALGLTVYSFEAIEDPNLAPYCRQLNEVFPSIKLSFQRNSVNLKGIAKDSKQKNSIYLAASEK